MAGQEAEARDLTQETFRQLAREHISTADDEYPIAGRMDDVARVHVALFRNKLNSGP